MSNFYEDVIKKSPLFESHHLVDSLDLLEPTFRAKVQAILHDAEAHGVQFKVYETYRSTQRQLDLFNQGASKLKAVGVHHYGLAADIVFIHGGQPSWKGDFGLLGQLAKAHELIWGGDWGSPHVHHTFVDSDHVQWCSLAKQAALFRGEWYPTTGYNPYQA